MVSKAASLCPSSSVPTGFVVYTLNKIGRKFLSNLASSLTSSVFSLSLALLMSLLKEAITGKRNSFLSATAVPNTFAMLCTQYKISNLEIFCVKLHLKAFLDVLWIVAETGQ